MGSLRKLASQTALYGVSSVVGRFLNWLLTPVLLAYYTPEEYGVYTDLLALAFYPLALLTFGQETALFRWAGAAPRAGTPARGETRPGPAMRTPEAVAYSNAFFSVALFVAGFGGIMLLFGGVLTDALGYAARPELPQLLLGVLLLDALAAVPLAHLRHRERAGRFATVLLSNVGVLVGGTLVVVYGLGWTDDIRWLLWVNLLASTVKLALALVGNLPTRFRPEPRTWRPMLAYGCFIMLAGLAGGVNEALDRNLLPRLWPDGTPWYGRPRSGFEMNAIYGAVYKLAMLLTLATQAYRFAAEPFFFRAAADHNAPRTYARVFHYYSLVAVVVVLLTAAFRYEIAGFTAWGALSGPLLPEVYWVGLEVVPVLLLANLFLGAYVNLSIWFKLTKQVRFGLLFASVGAGITLGVNLTLIPAFGYWACAVATAAAYGTMAFLAWRTGARHYPVPYHWPRLTLLLAAAAGVFFVIELTAVGPNTGSGGGLLKLVLIGAWAYGTWWLEQRRPVV